MKHIPSKQYRAASVSEEKVFRTTPFRSLENALAAQIAAVNSLKNDDSLIRCLIHKDTI